MSVSIEDKTASGIFLAVTSLQVATCLLSWNLTVPRPMQLISLLLLNLYLYLQSFLRYFFIGVHLVRLHCSFTHFWPMFLFFTLKNTRKSWLFQGQKMRTLARNRKQDIILFSFIISIFKTYFYHFDNSKIIFAS